MDPTVSWVCSPLPIGTPALYRPCLRAPTCTVAALERLYESRTPGRAAPRPEPRSGERRVDAPDPAARIGAWLRIRAGAFPGGQRRARREHCASLAEARGEPGVAGTRNRARARIDRAPEYIAQSARLLARP